MSNQTTPSSTSPTVPSPDGERIDSGDVKSVEKWGRKLDATEAQIREAVSAVGDKATDVELHLKGSRSRTNADRVEKVTRNESA